MLDYLGACSHEAIVDTLPKVGLEIEELSELKPGDEIAPGWSPRSHADGKQYLVELSVLSNRPDCLGMIGIAREIAAFLKLKLRYPLGSPSTGERSGAAPVGLKFASRICVPATCAN
jgi:phenylalanyl-tRNA synthetase beta subunit